MINEISDLFKKDLIYVKDVKDSNQLFEVIGHELIKKGLVKDNFVSAIIEREKNYPTGIDLSVVEGQKYNVAIPHTEREYCNSKCIVFVKIKNEINFKNMIAQDEELNVKYVFIIINNENEVQTNILSNIMDFITKKSNMDKLEQIDNEKELYEFITGKKESK
ncbi:PTS sugar transporter subunit IIA [Clostridium sp. cel8]|uniref:PTS sugar transporter subunit IIA n=1 Tax=unclassified Clostridium TaxID=2614128 RepID=UPI0015F4FDB1|nr:PTS sugar transporter subunit IIA [Clostridium sp. cel8]